MIHSWNANHKMLFTNDSNWHRGAIAGPSMTGSYRRNQTVTAKIFIMIVNGSFFEEREPFSFLVNGCCVEIAAI